VEANKGVEEKEPWLESVDGIEKSFLVELGIEPKRRGGDDVDVELGELELQVGTDAFESSPDDVQGVLGGVEENTSFARNGKVSQARRG